MYARLNEIFKSKKCSSVKIVFLA